jgi:hypothetical protein
MDGVACYTMGPVCFSGKIDLGLIITVLLFFLGFAINKRITDSAQLRTRRKYLLALKEEIGLNVASLEKSTRIFPPQPNISQFLRQSKDNVPWITFSFYSVIFRNRTEVLQDLDSLLINNIVDFYGKLDEIDIDIRALSNQSFKTISDEGRECAFLDIEKSQHIAFQQGKSVRDAITLLLNSGIK